MEKERRVLLKEILRILKGMDIERLRSLYIYCVRLH